VNDNSLPSANACPRPDCGFENVPQAPFCARCGTSMRAPQTVWLEENRWLAAPDEIAVCYRAQRLKGIFSKRVKIPPGTRALLVRDNRREDLPEGDFTVQDFFDRFNNFFRAPEGDVLIYRTVALPVPFAFTDIKSAELRDLFFATTLQIAIGEVDAFRRRFMQEEGTVGTRDLWLLLAPTVRQLVAEYVGARKIDEMLRNADLRRDLEHALTTGLQRQMQELGLTLREVTALELRHHRLDEQDRRKGDLWLLRREGELGVDSQRALNEIYDQSEWAAIESEEADLRRRYRRGELKQEEAEQFFTLRLREIELLDRVANADTREAAIRLGGADEVAALEARYHAQQRERDQAGHKRESDAEEERARWGHIRALAAVARDVEKTKAELQQRREQSMESERIDSELDQLRIRNRIESARLLEDEAARREVEQLQREALVKAHTRDQSLADARHQTMVEEVRLASEAKRRQFERDLRLAEEEDLARVRARAEAQQKEWEREAQQRREKEAEAAHLRERELKADERAHELARAAQDQERLRLLASAPTELLISMADSPEKVRALAGWLQHRNFAGMSAEQIRAAQNAPATDGQGQRDAERRAEDALERELRETKRSTELMAREDKNHEAAMDRLLRMAEMIQNTAIGSAQANAQAQAGRPPATEPQSAPAATVVIAATPAPAGFTITRCPKCRTLVGADAVYCTKCGHALA
jgi:hypothetical protein